MSNSWKFHVKIFITFVKINILTHTPYILKRIWHWEKVPKKEYGSERVKVLTGWLVGWLVGWALRPFQRHTVISGRDRNLRPGFHPALTRQVSRVLYPAYSHRQLYTAPRLWTVRQHCSYVTPAFQWPALGFEPATLRSLVQHPDHWATGAP